MATEVRPALSGARDGRRRDAASGPLRVAFCIDSMADSGGTELNAVRVAEELTARGDAAVTTFTFRGNGPMRARYAAAGIAVEEFPLRSLVAPSTVRQVAAMARRFRDGGYDVVHSHDLYSNVVATAAGRLAGVPAVIASKRWIHWRRAHRVLNQYVAYRLAHCTVANSAHVARTLHTEEHVPEGRVRVVPNFLEPAAFAPWPPARRAEALAAIGVPAGAPVIGTVARLRSEKNHAALLRAAVLLRGRWPALRVVLIGEGPERESLAALAGTLGIADAVHFAGHRPNRPNPHALLDVSVLCSFYEGFPNTVIEAMAAGRPVVASRVGGIPDAVEDGATGYLVPADDPEALAQALGRLLEDPARAAALGERGRQRAWDAYHVDRVLPGLVGLYRELIAARRA